MLRFNNKLVRVNGNIADVGYVPPGPEPEPFIQYYYTTFKPTNSGYTRLYWDPASGVPKYFNNSYSKDLTAGTQFQTNGGSGDWPNLTNLDSTHLYEFVWSDQDIRSSWSSGATTASYSNGSNSQYPSMVFGELYSLDLLWMNTNTSRFPNVTLIPQDYRNIWRSDYFTDCSYMFQNAPITNSIEKFILAMQQACPNLTTTTGCFSGCTTAPDYNYCLTTYPNWF